MKNKLIVVSLFIVVSAGVMAQENAIKEIGNYAEQVVTQLNFIQNDSQCNHTMTEIKVGYKGEC